MILQAVEESEVRPSLRMFPNALVGSRGLGGKSCNGLNSKPERGYRPARGVARHVDFSQCEDATRRGNISQISGGREEAPQRPRCRLGLSAVGRAVAQISAGRADALQRPRQGLRSGQGGSAERHRR